MSCPLTLIVALITMISSTGPARASVVTVTFDDLQLQPVDGLSHLGAKYDFKLDGVNSSDAEYGTFGPVATEHVTDPSMVGNSRGVLTIDFEWPTPNLEFGLAVSSNGPVTAAAVVQLFDELDQLIATESVDAPASNVALGFADALFEYSGTPVSRAVIDFADAPGSFAIDNLRYTVPEPTAATSLLLGATFLAARHRRRRNTIYRQSQ